MLRFFKMSNNIHQDYNRLKKIDKLIPVILRYDLASDSPVWSGDPELVEHLWSQLAHEAGVSLPSMETRGQVFGHLKELEAAIRKIKRS